MDLFLVRHGQARLSGEDPERGLADLGIEQVETAARWTSLSGASVSQIWHSGKKRAQQTAEIFARHVPPPKGVVEVQGLLPTDDVIRAAELVEAESENVLIVGHLPFLSRLASALIAGDPERVGFGMFEATVLCLHRREGRWYVRWMVTPNEI
jgi:phosphohistidine phosphatase